MFTELKIYHEKKNHASPCLRRKISGKAFGSKKKIMQKKNCPTLPPSLKYPMVRPLHVNRELKQRRRERQRER